MGTPCADEITCTTSNFGILVGFTIFFMTAYLLAAEYITAHPRIWEILVFRCKHLSTSRNRQSKTSEESSAQNSSGALALRKKPEQGGADGERAVGIQHTNVLYKTKVDYLL